MPHLKKKVAVKGFFPHVI